MYVSTLGNKLLVKSPPDSLCLSTVWEKRGLAQAGWLSGACLCPGQPCLATPQPSWWFNWAGSARSADALSLNRNKGDTEAVVCCIFIMSKSNIFIDGKENSIIP